MSKNRVIDSFLPFYLFLPIIETLIDRLTIVQDETRDTRGSQEPQGREIRSNARVTVHERFINGTI